jgi:hypothetical protein
VYVADRFVLPALSADELLAISLGKESLDAKVKTFVQTELAYRFVVTTDTRGAFHLERTIQRGEWPAGKPFLNPA